MGFDFRIRVQGLCVRTLGFLDVRRRALELWARVGGTLRVIMVTILVTQRLALGRGWERLRYSPVVLRGARKGAVLLREEGVGYRACGVMVKGVEAQGL